MRWVRLLINHAQFSADKGEQGDDRQHGARENDSGPAGCLVERTGQRRTDGAAGKDAGHVQCIELHRDWRNDVEGLAKICSDHIPDYRNLITSYSALTAAK